MLFAHFCDSYSGLFHLSTSESSRALKIMSDINMDIALPAWLLWVASLRDSVCYTAVTSLPCFISQNSFLAYLS